MTCREFDTVVAELVRNPNVASSAESQLDTSVRAAGAEHAAECTACGTRWIAEERLSASLKALSAASDSKVSDAVEQRLLEAFRARKAAVVAPEVATIPTAKVLAFRSTVRTRMYWAGAIAAAITLVTLLVSVRSGKHEPDGTIAKRAPEVTVPQRVAAVEPKEVAPVQRAAPLRAASRKQRPREPQMVATEFVPMERGGFIEPMDRGQLVRVQVPRMAMRNAGFPVREDRLNEPVLADVLVGEDGTARGIRFVKFTQ